MTPTMLALVKYGLAPGAVELRNVARPVLTDDRVLVAPHSVGVCGSDVHMWQNHQSWAIKSDVILGHEVSGTILEVGARVSGWQVGDRVVCETAETICGECGYCRTGKYNLCPSRRGYGGLADGSMSELVSAEPRVLHRIPDSVDMNGASMTEPYCVGYNALVERGRILPGDIVVVQGVGPIGSVCIQIAKMMGAARVVALGTSLDKGRLELARGFGADESIDVTETDALGAVSKLGDGLGADVVVDATGASAALVQAMDLVRPLGHIVKVGWGPQPLNVSLDPIVAKAVSLHGSFSHTWKTWERVLHAFEQGLLNPYSVIGGVYPVSEWETAFTAMANGENIKSVIQLRDAEPQ